MKLAAIAFRNLSRNRRRTLLALMVVAAGTAGLLITAGFVRASFDGLADAIVRGGLGHLEVAPDDGQEPASVVQPRPPALEDWEAVRRTIEEEPGVRAAQAVVHLAGLVTRDDRSLPFVALAVEPDRERAMDFEVEVREGHNLQDEAPAEGADEVLLALGLARALGAAPGDVVTVTAVNPSGMLNAMDMIVAGLFTTGLTELDSRMLKMHLASAARLTETDRVSAILVSLADPKALPGVGREIGRKLSHRSQRLRVLDWTTRAPFYAQVRSLYSGIFVFLGGLIFLLVSLSNSNALLMAMMERVNEIGTLRALGTSRGQVAALFLFEALWLGLLGALLGALLGVGASLLINAVGIQLPPPPGGVNPMDLRVTPAVPDFLLAAAVMVVVMAVSAVLPILRATRLRIVDALGHV